MPCEDKDRQILNVEDPRDAFIIMLMERIECLEDRLNKVIEPRIDSIDHERLNIECRALITGSTTSQTFEIKLYHYNPNLSVVMTLCENTVRAITDKLGHTTFRSASAIIEKDAFTPDYAIIYINMRRRCWVHETIKAISDIGVPCIVKIDKHICSAFNAYVGIDEMSNGLIYNAYDLEGNHVLNPSWQQWTRSAKILS